MGMGKSWIIDSRAIARKVRHANLPSVVQIEEGEAKRQCPKCHVWIDNSDVSYEWSGLPAGVKFDPSDAELLEHLASKCGVGEIKPHTFIDEFIPTLDKGICSTHPKDLPGATLDGSIFHFFHKTSNAYASGQRKRRKIQNDQSLETVRWHKTGKTKSVYDNGVQKGCKKIMVLYATLKNGSKPVKTNWVMHQYHLGTEDDEGNDEFVVSKIFYQKDKQTDENIGITTEDSKALATPNGPKTPNTLTPNPPRGSSTLADDIMDESIFTDAEEKKCAKIEEFSSCIPQREEAEEASKPPEYLAGESQAQEDNLIDNDSLLCKEFFESCSPLDNTIGLNDLNCNGCGLDSIHFDTPPDFLLGDPHFGSQDSICNLWEYL